MLYNHNEVFGDFSQSIITSDNTVPQIKPNNTMYARSKTEAR